MKLTDVLERAEHHAAEREKPPGPQRRDAPHFGEGRGWRGGVTTVGLRRSTRRTGYPPSAQVTIPRVIADHYETGQCFDVHRETDGRIILTPS